MGPNRWQSITAVGVLQALVLGSVLLLGTSSPPHRAPVAVVAPPVVVTAVADQADAVEDGALQPRIVTTPAAARKAVADGSVVAAVIVDLRVEQDTVLLASANGAALNRAVLQLFRTVESSFGRDVVVQNVVPTRVGDDDARGVYAIVGLCVLLGFAVPIVITWVRGPVARTLRLGLLRLLAVAVSTAMIGVGIASAAAARYDGAFGSWWLIATLVLLATAAVTLALESVVGVVGIGVAAAGLVLTAAPLAWLASAEMLSVPWALVTPWLPHGAGLDAARGLAYFGGSDAQPLRVLVAWVVLAVVTMAVARRERWRETAPTASPASAGRVDP